MNTPENILTALCALLAAMFAVCGRNSPVNGKGRKAKKAPIISVCLMLLACGGCGGTPPPPAPILDPENLRQSCIEQQEYRTKYFPDGCKSPGYRQCRRSGWRMNLACKEYVEQSKDEDKTWACAEGHSCR